MILDTLSNLEKYIGLHPLFRKAADFILGCDLSALSTGKIEIQGDVLFVNVNEQPAKSRDEVPLESHIEYIDIQIPISVCECMGYTPGNLLSDSSTPYSQSSDVAFYPGLAHSYFNVEPGMFAIFFPGEGHAPAITSKGVKKIIVKIRK